MGAAAGTGVGTGAWIRAGPEADAPPSRSPPTFLDLRLKEDLYALTERLRLLLSGAVGAGVKAESVPGGEHGPGWIEVRTTGVQALMLAGRLTP